MCSSGFLRKIGKVLVVREIAENACVCIYVCLIRAHCSIISHQNPITYQQFCYCQDCLEYCCSPLKLYPKANRRKEGCNCILKQRGLFHKKKKRKKEERIIRRCYKLSSTLSTICPICIGSFDKSEKSKMYLSMRQFLSSHVLRNAPMFSNFSNFT